MLTIHRAPAGLKKQVEEEGFTNCSQRILSTFDGDGEFSKSDVFAMGVEQSMTGIVSRGGAGTIQTQEDVKRVADQLRADMKNGHELGVLFWFICGQNPPA
jgi:hypothetical protein